MLLLLFHLGDSLHALDASHVVEVLALVRLAKHPGAPVGVVGTLNHRGDTVPVVDICQFALGRPAHARLSTRIILAKDFTAPGGERVIGLVAEHATETLRQDDRPDYLQWDSNADHTRGLVQVVDVPMLVPESVRHFLYGLSPLPPIVS